MRPKQRKRGGGVDKHEKKLKIEFNRKLKVIHDHTKDENGTIIDDDLNIFKQLKSFLDFNEDRMKFEISVHYAVFNQLDIKEKSVKFTIAESTVDLPLIPKENELVGDHRVLHIHASFKDDLLHLFSFHKKEFCLIIKFDFKQNVYTSSFIVSIPNIEDQTGWEPHEIDLDQYRPDKIGGFEINRLFHSRFRQTHVTGEDLKLLEKYVNYSEAHIDDRFSNFNFLNIFQHMVAIEDLEGIKKMKEFAMDLQTVHKYNECPLKLKQEVDGHLKHIMCESKIKDFVRTAYVLNATHKMPPDIMAFENIKLIDSIDYQNNYDDFEGLEELSISGKISYIFGNIIVFYFPKAKRRQDILPLIDTDRPFRIEFEPNRITYRVAQRAIQDAIKNDLKTYLKNFEQQNATNADEDMYDLEWFNPDLEDNEEQQMAVENINNRTAFPSPFIIFGGPGTGKSSTIVEAIAQIVKLKPKASILVTASSNSTCDDIGNRLLKYISVNKMYRLYSPSFGVKPDKIDEKLQKISNFRQRIICNCKKRSCPEDHSDTDPSYEEFFTARVVIVTLGSCGRLVSAGIKSNHFDYIFIDEAGSETECTTYIPIVGLGIDNKRAHAQIILSGDHKQLGPIVTNSFAKKLGMEMSLMERLMQTDEKYQREGDDYDTDYVVQLKQNYRNHPKIMEFSNVNWYDTQLISVCSDEVKNFGLDEEILMFNSAFPIIFHTTKAKSEEVGTSLKNENELKVMQYYIEKIFKNKLNGNKVEQSDIGLISPYRGQRDRMIEEFSAAYPKIEIGTIDAFQGREKKIIIFSCVRSGTTHVGFLKNEKRLNVALTRGQSLVIIIGNANTLQKCPIWNKFITYCYENKGIIGDINSVNYVAAIDETLAEKEELPDGDVQDEFV